MKYIIVLKRGDGQYEDYYEVIEETYLIDTDKEDFNIEYEYNLYLAHIFNTFGLKCSVRDKEAALRFDYLDNPKKYKGIMRETNKLLRTIEKEHKKEMNITYFVEEVLKAEKVKFTEYNL